MLENKLFFQNSLQSYIILFNGNLDHEYNRSDCYFNHLRMLEEGFDHFGLAIDVDDL